MRLVGAAHAGVAFFLVLKKAMQKRQMHRIDVALVGLQVIALVINFVNAEVAWRLIQKFIIGQQRRFARSHVSENNAALFLARISEMTDRIAIGATARFARLLQAAAANIVEPTMVETTQPAVFDAAITQIGAAMGAMQTEQANPALIVAKQRQVLAENPHRQRRAAGGQL